MIGLVGSLVMVCVGWLKLIRYCLELIVWITQFRKRMTQYIISCASYNYGSGTVLAQHDPTCTNGHSRCSWTVDTTKSIISLWSLSRGPRVLKRLTQECDLDQATSPRCFPPGGCSRRFSCQTLNVCSPVSRFYDLIVNIFREVFVKKC